MPNGGWESPYGTVSRGGRGDTAYQDYWQRRMGYQQPATPPMAPWLADYLRWSAGNIGDLTAGARSLLPGGAAWRDIGPTTTTPTASYPGMRPPALGDWPVGTAVPYPTTPERTATAGATLPWTGGPTPPGLQSFMPSTAAPSDAYLPLIMKGPWPGGAAPTAQAGGEAGAGVSATAGEGGAFGPFGSIEDWRNQFYSEHGRWPTSTDAQDAIASFGFLGQTGRPPSQQEWEDRWHGGWGGTTQWGPIGGRGRGGGGGWGAPPQPSWWGANVLGDEGWTYLPTEPGKYPGFSTPERGESALPPWYDIKNMRTFQQVPQQHRDWLQQVMQSQQRHWENPLMAPIQWAQPAWSEL